MKISLAIPATSHTAEGLLALRRVIVHLADRCGLDLADRSALRHFLDGDFSQCPAPVPDDGACHDLRAILILLYRLEASSSEDLGIAGLRRLWQQHSETLANFPLQAPMTSARQLDFPAA